MRPCCTLDADKARTRKMLGEVLPVFWMRYTPGVTVESTSVAGIYCRSIVHELPLPFRKQGPFTTNPPKFAYVPGWMAA